MITRSFTLWVGVVCAGFLGACDGEPVPRVHADAPTEARLDASAEPDTSPCSLERMPGAAVSAEVRLTELLDSGETLVTTRVGPPRDEAPTLPGRATAITIAPCDTLDPGVCPTPGDEGAIHCDEPDCGDPECALDPTCGASLAVVTLSEATRQPCEEPGRCVHYSLEHESLDASCGTFRARFLGFVSDAQAPAPSRFRGTAIGGPTTPLPQALGGALRDASIELELAADLSSGRGTITGTRSSRAVSVDFGAERGTFTPGVACRPNPCELESASCDGDILDYQLHSGVCRLPRPPGFASGEPIAPSCDDVESYHERVDCRGWGSECFAPGATCVPNDAR